MADSQPEIIRELLHHIAEAQRLTALLEAAARGTGATNASTECRTFDPTELLTVEQAAHLVRCTDRTIYRRIDREPELSVKVGGKRRVRRSVLLKTSSNV